VSETTELVAEALDRLPGRILKVLEEAGELGWTTGKVSLCVRLSKPDDIPDRAGVVALPFYCTWTLDGFTPKTGKPSWHFLSAAASNGQPLSEGDILTYLEDPSVIRPEPPEEQS
jgi:hypothetical protein